MNEFEENDKTQGGKHAWQAPALILLDTERTEGKPLTSPGEVSATFVGPS